MSTVVSVSNLGKKYIIDHEQEGSYSTLAESLTRGAKSLFTRSQKRTNARHSKEEFWALRELNFDIQSGDRMGIIGHNGAGKSTLLKLLSRITQPSTGQIGINGKVASLLEVGTGFHPELTGRENIFLNGAIMGMSRKDILKRFDQIVAFSEVEKFLDTPVKRYSSGMYVRLAFAVAAHLESDILIIDEVLAVGDAQFQKKCLGKIKNVGEEGRTVLFVSHNMNAVEQFCNKALLLGGGTILTQSNNVREVIGEYLNVLADKSNQPFWHNTKQSYQNPNFTPEYFGIEAQAATSAQAQLSNDQDIQVKVSGQVAEIDPALQVGFALYNDENQLLFWSVFNDGPEKKWCQIVKGHNSFLATIPRRFLNEGTYRLELMVALYFRAWIIEPQKDAPTIFFTIQGGLSDSPYWLIRRPGIMAPELEWRNA